VSLILGALCIMLGRRFPTYLVAKLSGREFHTEVNWAVGPRAGQEVAYWELNRLDSMDGGEHFSVRACFDSRGLALWVITSRMAGKNRSDDLSIGCARCHGVQFIYGGARDGDGTIPLMSGIAAAMGGYMAMYQWKLLRVLNTGRAAPMT